MPNALQLAPYAGTSIIGGRYRVQREQVSQNERAEGSPIGRSKLHLPPLSGRPGHGIVNFALAVSHVINTKFQVLPGKVDKGNIWGGEDDPRRRSNIARESGRLNLGWFKHDDL